MFCFARHGLISKRYFKAKFGVTAKTGYNVDSFGHNQALPKILKASGMDNYISILFNFIVFLIKTKKNPIFVLCKVGFFDSLKRALTFWCQYSFDYTVCVLVVFTSCYSV